MAHSNNNNESYETATASIPLRYDIIDEKKKYDQPLKVFNNTNNNALCVIFSGGSPIDTAEKSFERYCYKSSLNLYILFMKLGIRNIGMISPIQNFTTGNIEISPAQNFTTKNAKSMIESIKKKHSETPYSAFYLVLNGHNPVDDMFYVSKDCQISLSDLNSVTEHFASCDLYIIKDMCKAEAFDLLPIRSKANKAVQWSSCTYNGESFTAEPGSSLFIACIISGIIGQCCPIKKLNYCDICFEFKKYLKNGGEITYEILSDWWVKPHMKLVVSRSDIPVLVIYNTTEAIQDSLPPDKCERSYLVPSRQLAFKDINEISGTVGPVQKLRQGQNYCPLNIPNCYACTEYRTNITNREISPTDAQKLLAEQHMKMMEDRT